MWILPKNYPLSSHFVQDMVESKEDLTSPGLNIESSLMWRSKPSELQTWLRRWKPGSWIQHLYTRILKPSQRTSFETALTSSLAVTPASHSVQQESEKEQMTPDTCGLTSGDTLNQLDLFSASSRTSRDTSRLDSPQLSATWKKMVTQQRGEYSQRVKLAHPTSESESTSWPTPTVASADKEVINSQNNNNLVAYAKMFPTPAASDYKGAPSLAHVQERARLHTRGVRLPEHVSRLYNIEVRGNLNPEWVEWLMGVPTGWTDLDSWVTGLSHKPQQKPTKL